MASSTIMHGRREGQKREYNDVQVSVIPEGYDQRDVTVIQPADWNRIQNSLAHYNKEEARLKALHEEREALHNMSKEMVQHWGNTIEGQRIKKLQARKIREEKEEEERVKIDIEEAKLQAQKRKEAIERAKTQQYYQTDRVKTFHGALLLTEVMKEREAQINMKKSNLDAEKIRDEHLLRLQRRQLEEAIRQDQKRALQRYNQTRDVAGFQLLQIKDNVEEAHRARQSDLKEGKNVKQQVEMYQAAKAAIEEKRRQEKRDLMEDHQNQLSKREELRKEELKRQEQEDEEIRQFANAKKKMSKMRKEKETELFNVFQEHTERMRKKLHDQMVQKVDNEDERIAKALAEREKQREEEERAKQEGSLKEKAAIHQHRVSTMTAKERKAKEDKLRDEEILKRRVESDKLFHAKQEQKRLEKLKEAKQLKNFQLTQVGDRQVRETEIRKEDLLIDAKNDKTMEEEERQFQEYAAMVIQNAKVRDRNPYPLIKAAQDGPGGGRGPKFDGKNGLRPSFLVCDGTGVQLPNYATATTSGHHTRIYGDPGKSRKRLGFTW
ncbi:coiled-coil domain-containing protein 173 [Exaiptasia diaphana]|uniref:Trichohyalin-plectin-homology domain-containing protein n=1 Tax=Exaiptasia diaphana TaxID=2652724 RepID=A0A913Y9G6_EXADI|nr:coiled-coil domain-containing protein 173 [Exaiptasia diaphana]